MLDKMYASFGILRITEIEDVEDKKKNAKFIMMNKNKNFINFIKLINLKTKSKYFYYAFLSWTENGYILPYVKNKYGSRA